MAGCVRKRFSAALEKLVWRATSRKVSSWSKSIVLAFDVQSIVAASTTTFRASAKRDEESLPQHQCPGRAPSLRSGCVLSGDFESSLAICWINSHAEATWCSSVYVCPTQKRKVNLPFSLVCERYTLPLAFRRFSSSSLAVSSPLRRKQIRFKSDGEISSK